MPQSKHDAVKPLRMRLIPGLLVLALVGCSSEKEQTDPDEQEQPQQEQGTWTPLPSGGPLAARSQVASVFDGQNVLLWGGRGGCTADGFCGDGARFNVAAKTWTPMSTQGALSARSLHTAVWTGERMMVWGGLGCGGPDVPCGDGATYDPASDAWSPPIKSDYAPAPRWGHTALWTGTQMLVWGGKDARAPRVFRDGAIYHAKEDLWTTMNFVKAPPNRYAHSAVWIDGVMYVWGGNGGSLFDVAMADGSMYGPHGDGWLAMPPEEGSPKARWSHTAVWTGSSMIIWGGTGCGDDPQQDPPIYCDKGAAFDPVYRVWSAISTKGAPSPRIGHTAVWTGSKMVIWGGTSPTCGSGGGVCSDGAAYDPATDTWAPLRTEGAPSARTGHVSVWTGNALFIWGGMGASGSDAPLSDGALWVP
ncbi:hypothetical protein D7Y27_20325 [Corallococcus sp. AB004]|nr:hypothetical protein D7X99_29595 [Corallococcus sp. AB032C]RKH96706.1 hypothetical protein D7Y04_30235 [Corallococcus sp. AB038B]RKI11140.1 hypothetical protein D7Y15_20750 [Corallococcus sp. AB030]RKI40476.1 hypothetical protein D7Y27_20325 [Corallococcus sp. AB004]RUO91420.1 hypothetical protein D7Y11_20100 [Corallococcus sp. AB018]